jgi:RND family efflux transporter MFP subunit
MKTSCRLAIVFCVSALLCACSPEEEKRIAAPLPRAVRVKTIASRDLPVVVSAVGRLAPNREVVLSAQVSGILTRYTADVGTRVPAGHVLVQLDATDYRLALQEAEANLRSAEVNLPVAQKSYRRARELLPDNVITQERYDQAEAAYASARALVAQLTTTVALARRRLEKTTITAPFGGHVSQRFVELGQRVAVGDPVMQVADMRTMRVNIHVNELDYVHVDKDDPVSVTVEAFSQSPTTGRVETIGVQADPRTNTFEIEILVDNPAFRLKAGLTARVSIQTDTIPDAIMIPQDSVLFRENRKEVFVLDANRLAEVRVVVLGRMDGSTVRILEGLRPGDTLVVTGAAYLKPGDKVTIAP